MDYKSHKDHDINFVESSQLRKPSSEDANNSGPACSCVSPRQILGTELSRDGLPSIADDGYITDSRSTTSSSVFSPLSFSSLSLNTLEGHQNLGAMSRSKIGNFQGEVLMNPYHNMPMELLQDGTTVLGNSTTNTSRMAGLASKHHDGESEIADMASGIEARLNSLTTITEEDNGLPFASQSSRVIVERQKPDMNVKPRVPNQVVPSPTNHRFNKRIVENPNFSNKSNYADATFGCYRAEPVMIRPHDSDTTHYNLSDNTLAQDNDLDIQYQSMNEGSYLPSLQQQQMNGQGWMDYTHFLEKHCEIPLHNIDPARKGMFFSSNMDNYPDVDTNHHVRTSSVPNSAKQEHSFSEGDQLSAISGREYPYSNGGGHNEQALSYRTSGHKSFFGRPGNTPGSNHENESGSEYPHTDGSHHDQVFSHRIPSNKSSFGRSGDDSMGSNHGNGRGRDYPHTDGSHHDQVLSYRIPSNKSSFGRSGDTPGSSHDNERGREFPLSDESQNIQTISYSFPGHKSCFGIPSDIQRSGNDNGNTREFTLSDGSDHEQATPYRIPGHKNSFERPGDNSNTEVGRGFLPGSRQQSYQQHLMSSMPDLRYQDHSRMLEQASGFSPYGLRRYQSPYQQQHQHVQQLQLHQQEQQQHNQIQQQQQQQHYIQQNPFQHQEHVHPETFSEWHQYPGCSPSTLNQYVNSYSMFDPSKEMINPSNRAAHGNTAHNVSSSFYPALVLRHITPVPSTTATQPYPDRCSWQPRSSYDLQLLSEHNKLNHLRLDRSSLDLGSIPQLEKQIRATSELCLQASRRHMFASSADIHKLFSGQKKPPGPLTSSSPNGFCKNKPGLHSSLAGSNYPELSQTVDCSPRSNHRRLTTLLSAPGTSSPGPVKADHKINIPPKAWTSVTYLPGSETDRILFQRQPQPGSPYSDVDRPTFGRRGSTADSAVDRPLFQRQSSEYSSETELQQIESNAQASKTFHKLHGSEILQNNHGHDFRPLNRSLDQDSNIDITENGLEGGAVYANQAIVAQTSSNRPPSSEFISRPYLPSHATGHMQYKTNLQHLQAVQNQSPPKPYQKPPQPSSSSNNSSSTIPHSNNNNGCYNVTSLYNGLSFSDSMALQNKVRKFHSQIALNKGYYPNDLPNIQKYSHNSGYSYKPGVCSDLVEYNNRSSPSSTANVRKSTGLQGESSLNSGGLYPRTKQAVTQADNSHFQDAASNQPHRHSSAQLSPLEIAQILDTPFETNIVSDDKEDRLSTLV